MDSWCAGEHHAEAIQSDADTTGGWHTAFECLDEIVIHLLRLVAGLVFETFALDIGVVGLGVTR